MATIRHFLGWDEALTTKVRRRLLPDKLAGPADLGDTLVVVPTAQAGRRLAEALVKHCAACDSALLSCRIVESSYFFRLSETRQAGEASPTAVKAVWAHVLLQAGEKDVPALLPAAPGRDFDWALRTGESIQNLRNALADGCYRLTDVPAKCGDQLEEPERWRDLAVLEHRYLERLRQAGLTDPCIRKIEHAEHPELPVGIRKVIVAGVPDPSLLAIHALERLSSKMEVEVLIHAPDELAQDFDQWGRPIPVKWAAAGIDIPDPQANLLLCGTPADQSLRVVEEIEHAGLSFSPADIAIGVPDKAVASLLETVLAEAGLPVFNPADKPFSIHPLYQLIEVYSRLVAEGSYRAVRDFFRHADVLASQGASFSAYRLLRDLDELQNKHLPRHLDDISGKAVPERAAELRAALTFAERVIREFSEQEPGDAVRAFLQTIYKARKINPQVAEDEEFQDCARLVDDSLHEFDTGFPAGAKPDRRQFAALLMRRLGELSYHRKRTDSVTDLEGWLEIPWNDAPFLLVTGMNEESVPGGRSADAFMPDSIRRILGLRDDSGRLARDAFLMKTLIESRRGHGRVCFIVGKTGPTNDPLRPSRLLFRCKDAELPARAKQLFGKVKEERVRHAPKVSFMLDPRPPADLADDDLRIDRLSATEFRGYLECPFRFYLKRILGMEELDDSRMNMDAMDFGTMVHAALQAMARDPGMRACGKGDEEKLGRLLAGRAQAYVERQYGASPPAPVLIALSSATERLAAAARAHLLDMVAGWEIVEQEERHEMKLGGLPVVGRIDRIDRNRNTGALRVLDYKTSDDGVAPEKAHLAAVRDDTPDYARINVGGKEKRWTDLQLPLYAMFLSASGGFTGPVSLAYFNLPKTVTDTGVKTWAEFNNELLASAKTCAEEVIGRIRGGVFWPPSKKVKYEDFDRLFHGDPIEHMKEFNCRKRTQRAQKR